MKSLNSQCLPKYNREIKLRYHLAKLVNNNILKSLTVLFGASQVTVIILLLNTSLLINAVGMQLNGVIFFGLAYVGIFNAIFNFQSYTALIKFLPKATDHGERANIIKQGLIFDIITAIGTLIFSNAMLGVASNWFGWDEQIVEACRIISFVSIFTINGTFDAVLRFFSYYKYVGYISILTALSNTILITIGDVFDFSFQYFLYATLAGVAVRLLLSLFLFVRVVNKEALTDSFYRKVLIIDKEMLRFNIFSNFSLVLDVPVVQLTPIVIGIYIGTTELAIFKVLERIGGTLSQITSVASQVIAPEISKKISENDIRGAKRLCNISGCVFLLFSLILVLIAFVCREYWLGYFIPDWSLYTYPIVAYSIFSVYKTYFFAQYYLFIFSGFEMTTIKILVVVNFLYLLSIYPVIQYLGLLGVIFLLIAQAFLVFTSKSIILRRQENTLTI